MVHIDVNSVKCFMLCLYAPFKNLRSLRVYSQSDFIVLIANEMQREICKEKSHDLGKAYNHLKLSTSC